MSDVPFERALDALRGFSSDGAPVHSPPAEDEPPLWRLLSRSQRSTSEQERDLAGRVVELEAAVFVGLLRSSHGLKSWAAWCETREAKNLKHPPKADIAVQAVREATLARQRRAPIAGALDQVGVERVHRAMFVTHAKDLNEDLVQPDVAGALQSLDELREEFICRYLLHVLHMRGAGGAIPTDWAMLYGTRGLLDAVDRFAPDRDIRFVTYASHWVRARLTRARTSFFEPLRDTGAMNEFRLGVRTAVREARAEGREPSLEELRELARDAPEVYWLRALGHEWSAARLTMPGASGGARVLELTTHDLGNDIRACVELRASWDRFDAALDSLTDRERLVIMRRVGLESGRGEALREIGEFLHLSRERVRQLQVRAVARLQQVPSSAPHDDQENQP